jgi:hypothetical protein
MNNIVSFSKKSLFIVGLSFSATSFSQTVSMLQTNEPTVGAMKTMYVCDVEADPLESINGTSAIWDFSQIKGGNSTETITIINPSSSPQSSFFPSSTKGYSISGLFTQFFSSTSQHRVSQGFVFQEQTFGTLTATFGVDDQKIVSYPFSFDSSLVDSYEGTMNFNLFGIPQKPSCKGVYRAKIDGQGTIQLPGGISYSDVIRFQIVDSLTTILNIPSPTQVLLIRKQLDYYQFSNSTLPLFSYLTIEIRQPGMPTAISSQKVILSSIKPMSTANVNDLQTSNYKIIPNPINDFFDIKGAFSETDKLTLYDVFGRPVKEVSNLLANQKISVADLPNGTYLLRFNDSEKTEKLIISH